MPAEPAQRAIVAEGYLVVKGKSKNGVVFHTARIDRVTARPPYLEGCEVAVKVKIRVPESVFDAALADVVIDVPAGDVIVPEVTIG